MPHSLPQSPPRTIRTPDRRLLICPSNVHWVWKLKIQQLRCNIIWLISFSSVFLDGACTYPWINWPHQPFRHSIRRHWNRESTLRHVTNHCVTVIPTRWILKDRTERRHRFLLGGSYSSSCNFNSVKFWPRPWKFSVFSSSLPRCSRLFSFSW